MRRGSTWKKIGRRALVWGAVIGTQIFWPFDTTPRAIPVLFIIDPLFTLPLLSGVLAVLVLKKHQSLGRQLNQAGLFLSLAYLSWALCAGEIVENRVREKLARQEISYSQLISSPAPFTTLLWRVVGIEKNRYFETYISLFDGSTPLFFDFYPRNLALISGIEEHPPVVKLKWFTRGYYSFSTVDEYVINPAVT